MNRLELIKNIKKKKSFLCVGLDTDTNLIPEYLKDFKNPVFQFNKNIIDATAKYTVAYKPNLAFYEVNGASGWNDLELTIKYIKEMYPDIFIIADAKRADIGNTSKMYAKGFFENSYCDAVTVNPYMGEDSVTPFYSYKEKWVIILALTSNTGAFNFQLTENKATGLKLYEQVIQESKKWGNTENTMYVIGATKAEMLSGIRKLIPEHFLLVPGVGAQGGSLEEVSKYGLNKDCGLLVNSSRNIIYADKTQNFAKVAGEKAKDVQLQMEKLLKEAEII